MNMFSSSKWKLGIMILSLVSGTFLVLFNRSNLTHDQTSIELLKDSLVHNVQYDHRPTIFLNFSKIHQLKNAITQISEKDSLTQKDKETIKKIDQQLNQILNERN